MVKCPICSYKMYIMPTTAGVDEFDGEIINYTEFFECPKCKLLSFRHHDKWGIGYQRIKFYKKWYFYFAKWNPFESLNVAQKEILKTSLSAEDNLNIKLTLESNIIKTAFIFR